MSQHPATTALHAAGAVPAGTDDEQAPAERDAGHSNGARLLPQQGAATQERSCCTLLRLLCDAPAARSWHLAPAPLSPLPAQVPSSFAPQPNPEEVAAAFSMPLARFLQAHQHMHWDMRSRDK